MACLSGVEAMEERRHLDPKVQVIWFMPIAIALVILLLVGLLGFVVYPQLAVGWVNGTNFLLWLPLAAVAIAIPAFAWINLIYKQFTYEISETELVIRQGVITRRNTVIPYARIQDVRSERSLADRLLGIATLEIETAGAQMREEIILPGIANKDEFIKELLEKVEIAKEAHGMGEHTRKPAVEQLLTDMLHEIKKMSERVERLGGIRQNNRKELKKGEWG